MHQSKNFYIDLHEVFDVKTSKSSKKVPSFLVTLVTKIIRQDDLNDFIRKSNGATGVDFASYSMDYFNMQCNVIGAENLPEKDKKCVFASNHPLGAADGLCLSSILGNHYDKNVKYIVNDLLLFVEPLRPIFIPINKHGDQVRENAKILNEAFTSSDQIITFPAGLCSRKINGKISDLDWKKMLVVKAVEHKRDIVPIYFEARNSNFFYNIANIRARLKIKFNVEMLFLPRELFKIKKAKNLIFNIYIGKPISWQTFDSSKTPQQWTNWMKQTVYDLDKTN